MRARLPDGPHRAATGPARWFSISRRLASAWLDPTRSWTARPTTRDRQEPFVSLSESPAMPLRTGLPDVAGSPPPTMRRAPGPPEPIRAGAPEAPRRGIVREPPPAFPAPARLALRHGA